jgi:hypothetical protein
VRCNCLSIISVNNVIRKLDSNFEVGLVVNLLYEEDGKHRCDTVNLTPTMAGDFESTTFVFDGREQFSQVVSQLKNSYEARKKTADDAKVLCMVDDGDEWLEDYDRSPLVIYEDDEAVNAAAVSKHSKYYEPVQFHEPFEALDSALDAHDVGVEGKITVGKYSKRLTSRIDFTGETVTDPTSNEVTLGMKIDTAHNGFSAVNVEIGAERLVCSNGMVAWDSEFSMRHEHNQGKFNEIMMHHAVESVLTSADRVKQQFERAHTQMLRNKDELFLLLTDCNIEWLFDDPLDAFHEAFETEKTYHKNPTQMEKSPSLYDCYMVGTHAIEHLSNEDASKQALNTARQRLTSLLENYEGNVPNADELVENSVERRSEQLATDGEVIAGEQEIVQRVASDI